MTKNDNKFKVVLPELEYGGDVIPGRWKAPNVVIVAYVQSAIAATR